MNDYQDRWLALFVSAAEREAHLNAYRALRGKYAEKHRAYHTFDHIKECLRLFVGVKKKIADPLAVELALWYHDVVYDTHSHTNEADSAQKAGEDLRALCVARTTIAAVKALVLLTQHPSTPQTPDQEFMLDIDLSILGAPKLAFAQYERNIRREYRWVPNFVYKRKRAELLQAFLNQERIYHSKHFFAQREATARANLTASLRALKKME